MNTPGEIYDGRLEAHVPDSGEYYEGLTDSECEELDRYKKYH